MQHTVKIALLEFATKEHAMVIRYSALTAYAELNMATVGAQGNGATVAVQKGSAGVVPISAVKAVSWACATKSHQVELLRMRMVK